MSSTGIWIVGAMILCELLRERMKQRDVNGEGRTKEVSSEEEGVTFDVDPAIQ